MHRKFMSGKVTWCQYDFCVFFFLLSLLTFMVFTVAKSRKISNPLCDEINKKCRVYNLITILKDIRFIYYYHTGSR